MEIRREKLQGARKYIAEAMRNSVQNHPPGRGFLDVDMTKLLALKNRYEAEGHRISMSALMAKVVAMGIKEYPRLNSRIEGDEIIYYDEVNCSFGIDVGTGLYVVVVKDLVNKSLIQIAEEFRNLVQKVKDRTLTLDDTRDGTFTLTCMSGSKVKAFESIITNDQCLIVGCTSVRKEVVVLENDEIGIRPISTIILTNEHAICDGHEADGLANLIYKITQDPEAYL